MTIEILIALTMFLAVFTQTVSGFGIAMVAMALLAAKLPVIQSTPLVAIIGLFVQLAMFWNYRKDLSFRNVWQLIAAQIITIPLGVIFLSAMDPTLVLFLLGILITGYALYAILKFKLPTLEHPAWAWVTGLVAGLLGGAYNLYGPPFIVYGDARGWKPIEFKVNIQAAVFFSNILVIGSHLFKGNYTPQVVSYLWVALPAALVGLLAGFALDKFINPDLFRKIVMVLLLVSGVNLLVQALL